METPTIQTQIDDINRKLDLVLEHMESQRQRSTTMDDLVSDLSIIGKDAYISLVDELDRQSVQVDVEELKMVLFKLVRNLRNVSEALDMFESLMDLRKEAIPIINQVGVDFIHKVDELDKKGYIVFFKEAGKILDNLVTHYSPEDVQHLAENIVSIMNTVKNLTQPEMLKAINNAVIVYKSLDVEGVQEYSLWRAMREMNTPEMKRGLGYMISFLKNLSRERSKNIS